LVRGGGVENADRFAGSPAHERRVSYLVNPSVATVTACSNKSKVKRQPFFDDCRWKTERRGGRERFCVRSHQDPPLFTAATALASTALLDYRTYPRWSPYKGEIVQEAITFEQNNVWRSNTYTWGWHFVVEEYGHVVMWDECQSATYHQDAGSSMRTSR
jgi:hypothetical protein